MSIAVDRTDLNTQVGTTFGGARVPDIVNADMHNDLEKLPREDTRQTHHRDGDRTQEGKLGQKMRAALPNALRFGLTGTPTARGRMRAAS